MSTEIQIPFPIKGFDSNWAYSAQPRLTTPGCLNVRGYSSDEERARGGSRPGVRPAYAGQIGAPAGEQGGEGGGGGPPAGGSAVQWLGWLDWGYGDQVSYGDGFDCAAGELSANDAWTAADAALRVAGGGVHPAGGSMPYVDASSGEYQLFAGDTWQDFVLEAQLAWTYGTTGDITLWASSVSGQPAGGVRVKVAMASQWVDSPGLGFTSELTITLESGSHKAVRARSMGVLLTTISGALRVEADATAVRAVWNGVEVASVPRDDGTCSKAGFTMSLSRPDGSPLPDPLIDFRLLDWRLTAGTRTQAISRKLVAAAGRRVWAESAEGVMGESAEDAGELADVPLYSAAAHGGRLFLVDGAAPAFYDPLAEAGSRVLSWVARKGQIDPTCRLVATWRNRLVLAGAAGDPANYFLSRRDDPWDFELAGDEKSATTGSLGESGRVGDPITALVPLSDDVLVIGCTRSVWVLHGDPMAGGRLTCRSDRTGILCQNAWTTDVAGNLYFLGEEGLFVMPPLGAPKNLSCARVPGLLSCAAVQPGLAAADGQSFVGLSYDADRHGLLIGVTPADGGAGSNWFFDLRNDAFWPEAYPADAGPTCAAYYSAATPAFRKLLLGGRDGRLYQFDASAKADACGGEDPVAIGSHVWIGAMRLSAASAAKGAEGSLVKDSIVTGAVAVLSGASDPVAYGLHAADTPEAALSAAAAAGGTWSAGRNAARFRVRGGAHAIQLANDSDTAGRWALESLAVEAEIGGRSRT